MAKIRAKIDNMAQKLKDTHEMRQLAEKLLRDQNADLIQSIEEYRKEEDRIAAELKNILKTYIPGVHTFKDLAFQVKKPPVRQVVDCDSLVERAIARGEAEALRDQGVLKYAVDVNVLQRLSGKLGAVYKQYITEEEGTSAVVMPASLKT